MLGTFLRRTAAATAATATAGTAYAYHWATTNMGDDAVDRLVTYCKVVAPAITEYKIEEARCEKLPNMLPMLFDPVSEEEQVNNPTRVSFIPLLLFVG